MNDNNQDINIDRKLLVATNKGDIDTVHSLLDIGANINARDDEGWTALIWAVAKGHKSVVKILLDRGADPNAQDKYGSTALMYAAIRDNTDLVQDLLSIDGIDRTGFDRYMVERALSELAELKGEFQQRAQKNHFVRMAKTVGLKLPSLILDFNEAEKNSKDGDDTLPDVDPVGNEPVVGPH